MTEPATPDRPPEGAGGWVLFSPVGAGVFAGIAGVAAWFEFHILVLLASVMLALILVVRGWSRASLARLTFERRLERTRGFPGDTVACSCTVQNRKLLPLVRVEVADDIPDAVAPEADDATGFARTPEGLTFGTSLLWYQKASWRHVLRCRRRGYYPIGPGTLRAGDLFGLLMRAKPAAPAEPLIVYPRLVDLRDLGLPSFSPLGDNGSIDPLHHDPLRFRGLREHTPEIPFRHIHWKATARTGRLQAKLFDPSCSLRVAILLDASAFSEPATRAAEDGPFELALSVAASLAWNLVRARNTVGLFSDVHLADGGPFLAIAPNAGLDHLGDLLAGLAKATQPSAGDRLLAIAEPHLASGTTLAVVSGGLPAGVQARLAELRKRGFPIRVFLIGEAPAPILDLPIRRLFVGGTVKEAAE